MKGWKGELVVSGGQGVVDIMRAAVCFPARRLQRYVRQSPHCHRICDAELEYKHISGCNRRLIQDILHLSKMSVP